MGDDKPTPRGTREELLTTQQIADHMGWRPRSVAKEMQRAGITAVRGYPAGKVRRWLARRPGRKGFHASHPNRPKPGEITYPRGTCSTCGRDDVAVTDRGNAYKHKPAQGVEPGDDGLCRGSWQPVRDDSEQEAG